MLKISCWTVLHGRVDQLKLIAIKSRHKLRTITLYHVGDNQHTQNIQNNQVIGENEKVSFIILDKTKQTFWPPQYITILLLHGDYIIWGGNFLKILFTAKCMIGFSKCFKGMRIKCSLSVSLMVSSPEFSIPIWKGCGISSYGSSLVQTLVIG